MRNMARELPALWCEWTEVGGVIVNPGDYVVGDEDGVVAIPAAHVEAIIAFAENAERVEAEMAEHIREHGSMRAAIEKFGRA